MSVYDCGDLHPDRRQALKRMAIQITALLPEDETEAARVLGFARQLVTGFLGDRPCSLCQRAGKVVPLTRDD